MDSLTLAHSSIDRATVRAEILAKLGRDAEERTFYELTPKTYLFYWWNSDWLIDTPRCSWLEVADWQELERRTEHTWTVDDLVSDIIVLQDLGYGVEIWRNGHLRAILRQGTDRLADALPHMRRCRARVTWRWDRGLTDEELQRVLARPEEEVTE